MSTLIKTSEHVFVTIVETIYHRPVNGQITSIEQRYNFDVPSEQPYVRRKDMRPISNGRGKGSVSEVWEKLDSGWIRGKCFLHLANEGKPLLQLSFDGTTPHLSLSFRRDMRMSVEDIESVWIRYVSDEGSDDVGVYYLTLFQE